METTAKTKRRRWLRWVVVAATLVVMALTAAVWTGLADRWMRRAVIGQLEKTTGGRVELGAFHFRWLGLRAELRNLTIHGREPEGTPAFFHADSLRVDIRVDSFFRRKISLDEVQLDRPEVHVRFEANGSSNFPVPKTRTKPGRPWRERIFELVVRKLRVNDGTLVYNDVRVPLAAEGGEFGLTMDYHAGLGEAFYLGEWRWEQMILAARRYIPFPSDLAMKFTLKRNSWEVNQVQWRLPHSEVDAEVALASLAQPAGTFRFRGRLSLEDFRAILRKPNTPGGQVDFSGEGRFGGKQFTLRGRYSAHEMVMPYKWFHAAGLSSRGSFSADGHQLEVPDFQASVLGGAVQGRVQLAFRGLQFRAETRARGMDLSALLAAVDNPSFPLTPLYWAGSVDVNSVTTWTADFKHVESRGLSLWAPPSEPQPGKIPASARLDYHYWMDRRAVVLRPSEVSTPTSHIEMSGQLGTRASALEVRFEAEDLVPWNDFINRLRGQDVEPQRIAGKASWQGRVTGPLEGPTFVGHARATAVSYGRLYWDEVEGDVTYSPAEFRLARGRTRRGRSTVQIELTLALDHWSFPPNGSWSLEANLDRAPIDDLQKLMGWSYPAQALLSGQFRGRGTRAEPELTGLFDLTEVDAWGFRFERARGQLQLRPGEVRIANAELRLANGQTRSGPAGILTGTFLYRWPGQEVAFDVTGAVIPIEGIPRLQTARLPLGGQLNFHLSGQGPWRAPVAEGTLRLVDLRVGQEVLGSFDGKLDSDGRRVRLDLHSAMSTGRLQGQMEVALGGNYPFTGELRLEGLDLDPFIEAALHLEALTGHSRVDGRFVLSGALARPGTLGIEADLSRLSFEYEFVKLESVGPVRLHYRRDEVRIEQARLRGADTDFEMAGSVRFAGDRPLDLRLAGTVNLRLAGGFLPELEARGRAQVNVLVEGTVARPRITGNARIENASAHYGNIPTGLSQVTGDFVFDASRLVFENVTAEAGGGRLLLGGSVTYGDGPLRYDLTARAARVRIRYPEGMSWQAGGNLRLSGTLQAGVLSGRVQVERLLMAQGFDLASLIVVSQQPVSAPTTTSPYLRNLQFDVEATSTPNAHMEWPGAHFESEASLRVRGTWEHPILLGHIHLLSGEITFRGNRYRLTRGDLNFANPFRPDPVLNVEAVTTIRQYEVTLNFTGPASKLTLAYRSDPPLPASDIIALLALGRTGEESEVRSLTAVQTPELGATTLLSEAISSQLGGRLERLFGISRFRVDPFLAGTGTEQNAAARVTIEQQLTRDLVITYITNVTSNQQQVIQVEYNVNRNVSIVALRDQNGTFGLDIKFKKRFK